MGQWVGQSSRSSLRWRPGGKAYAFLPSINPFLWKTSYNMNRLSEDSAARAVQTFRKLFPVMAEGCPFIYVILALRVSKNFTNVLWTRHWSCSPWLHDRCLNWPCSRRASELDCFTWVDACCFRRSWIPVSCIATSKYQIRDRLDSIEINLDKIDVADRLAQEKRTHVTRLRRKLFGTKLLVT